MEQFFIALALMIVSAVLTAVLTPRPQRPAPPGPNVLADFNIPQIKDGTPQTVVFGDVWLTDWQVLYYGNLQSQPITTSSGGGKK